MKNNETNPEDIDVSTHRAREQLAGAQLKPIEGDVRTVRLDDGTFVPKIVRKSDPEAVVEEEK